MWWIDLRFLPYSLANTFLLVGAACLVAFGINPPRSVWRRCLTGYCAGLLGIVAVINVLQFYVLWARGAIVTRVPVPLSFFMCIVLGMIVSTVLQRPDSDSGLRNVVAPSVLCLSCVIIFPLAQMFCFGKTDYRRQADVAVVLGARVYADGRLSDALSDRVRTAVQLYHQGLARKLLMSGGPGEGSVAEPEAMKAMAIDLGVNAEDILTDNAGLNTQATARNSEVAFRRMHASRILVVSHFYHLPRIKLAYQRDGWEVYTVPAKENYLLQQMPYNMAREVAALWVYYLRPLVPSPAMKTNSSAA